MRRPWIWTSAVLLLLTGCATTMPTEPTAGPLPGVTTTTMDPTPAAPTQSIFAHLADFVHELAYNHLTRDLLKDAQDSLTWAMSGLGDAPKDPVLQYKAALCPRGIQLAVQDLQGKAAGFEATLRGLDATVGNLGGPSGGPHLILIAEKLAFGTALNNPDQSVASIRAALFQQIDLVVTSCRVLATSPNVMKAMKALIAVATKAGLVTTTGGAALPLLALKPL